MQMRCGWLTAIGVVAWAAVAPGQQPAPKLPGGVKAYRNLGYVGNGHERQKLDLYVPATPAGKVPVIVWIHGGGWRGGSKDRPPGISMAARDYAIASINYRLSQHAVFPAQIQDCKAAIRWLRAHAEQYSLDADHIGVWGASAGGHLVALLGTTANAKELEGNGGNSDQSSRVQAVVDLFGPTDLSQMGGSHNNPMSPESLLIGGPISQNKAKADKANPIAYVTKDSAPFLILHGDKDMTVPISQSEMLTTALRKAGVEVTFKIVAGAGHGGPAFRSPENLKLVKDFFDKHLRRGAPK